MSKFCSNCDAQASKLWNCTSCPEDNNQFCDLCAKIHPKVKKYKDHIVVAETELNCSNCECNLASFKCNHCPKNDSFFCAECVKIHPLIKAFRGHICVSLSEERNSHVIVNTKVTKGSFDYWTEFFMSHVVTLLPENLKNKSTVIATLVAAIVIYSVCRFIFGDRSVLGYSIIGYGAYHYYRSNQQKQRFIEDSVVQSSTAFLTSLNTVQKTAADSCSDQEFKNEFWHDREAKAAKFKTRGRAYNVQFHNEIKSRRFLSKNKQSVGGRSGDKEEKNADICY